MLRCTLLGVALAAVLGLNGCYFTSQNPLPKSELDLGLIGCWKTLPEKDTSQEPAFILFMQDQDGYFQIVVLEGQYKYSEMYRGFCSMVNGRKFLNVKAIRLGRELKPPEMDAEYSVIHYSLKDPKKLEMSLLSEKTFAAAVKAGRLQGKIDPQSKDLALKDTSENLAKFIQSLKPSELLDDALTPAEKTECLPAALNP